MLDAGYWILDTGYRGVLIAGVAGGFAAWFLNKKGFSISIILPLIGAWLLFRIQKWILNYRIQKAIDRCLSD